MSPLRPIIKITIILVVQLSESLAMLEMRRLVLFQTFFTDDESKTVEDEEEEIIGFCQIE